MKKLGKKNNSASTSNNNNGTNQINNNNRKTEKTVIKQPLQDKAIDFIKAGNVEALSKMCEEGSTEIKFLNRFHTKSGKTSLAIAADENSIDCFEVLIAAKANIDLVDKYGMTPFLYATQAGNIDIMESLSLLKADLTVKNLKLENALMLACNRNQYKAIKVLFEQSMIQTSAIDDKNIQEETALLIALKFQYFEIAKYLIENGEANVNIRTVNENTALIRSAFDNRLLTIEFIINHNGDVNLQNINGETALIIAIKHNHIDIVEFLLKSNANINLLDNSKRNALMIACLSGNYHFIDMLLSPSTYLNMTYNYDAIDINHRDIWGYSALMYLCCTSPLINKNKLDIQEKLIIDLIEKYNASIDCMDINYYTALMHCCCKEYMNIVILLLKLGANPYYLDMNNQSMIDLIPSEENKITFQDNIEIYKRSENEYNRNHVLIKPEWINLLNYTKEIKNTDHK